MAVFSGPNIKAFPGTLYAAPLGTTEPTSVTGVWPTGWIMLGYTQQGTQFEDQTTAAAITPEEEIYAVRNVTTDKVARATFALAEFTAQNLRLALNLGANPVAYNTAATGTNPDGSLWTEPPVPGTEVRVMIGWDALPKGASSGVDPFARLILRQCWQDGNMQMSFRKGNAFATYACQFSCEKPPTAEPYRFIHNANLAS